MRTIDQQLQYHLPSEVLESLYELGVINGCGGEGGFSFDGFVKDNLKRLSYFDKDKGVELYNDIRRICEEHDLDFYLQIGFTKANWRMARKIRGLLYWVTPFKRLVIWLGLFILLMKHGRKYYNQCNRGAQ